MDRREFIKRFVPVTALPFLINGFPIRAYGRSPFLETLIGAASSTDHVLVLVQLSGGNDGINTIIPLDQYSAYYNVRRNIAIPETSVLKLTDKSGLHPSMTMVKSLYDNAQLTIVQGVTYPNPNLSHFRATDIWLTASDYNQYLSSGWMGRYLDYEFTGYPLGYPNDVMPDPLAIQIGSVLTVGLEGTTNPMGIAIQDPTTLFVPVGGSDTAPQTPAGHELSYIRQVAAQAQQYSTQVQTAYNKAKNQATYPAQNTLANQFKTVARLIAGGLKTRIYVVNIGGFDNHSSQVVAADPKLGVHATLLQRLSEAIAAFQDDLRQLGVDNRVIGMTFSEFGRRVSSNASLGTDHGTAAPMFIFGKSMVPGIVGVNPSLTNLDSGNLKMQYDFRQVYASVLSEWFGVNQTELRSVLFKDFSILPLVSSVTDVTADNNYLPTDYALYQNYPNPFNPTTKIKYEVPKTSVVTLRVYDTLGSEVQTLVNGEQPAGVYEVLFDASRLASGVYFYRLRTNGFVETKKMILIK